MGVSLQRKGSRQHEDRAEEQPLQLQPGVGAHVEGLADDGIRRRDQHRHQDEPPDVKADEMRQRVDGPAEAKQYSHPEFPRLAVDRRSVCGAEIRVRMAP